MSARIDVMSIRKLGEYNSEIRGQAGKQVALGDWASAIFIPGLFFGSSCTQTDRHTHTHTHRHTHTNGHTCKYSIDAVINCNYNNKANVV